MGGERDGELYLLVLEVWKRWVGLGTYRDFWYGSRITVQEV